jgi:hypothetical protein
MQLLTKFRQQQPFVVQHQKSCSPKVPYKSSCLPTETTTFCCTTLFCASSFSSGDTLLSLFEDFELMMRWLFFE